MVRYGADVPGGGAVVADTAKVDICVGNSMARAPCGIENVPKLAATKQEITIVSSVLARDADGYRYRIRSQPS